MSEHAEHSQHAKSASVGRGYTHHSQTSLCPLCFSRGCTNPGRLQESNPEIIANFAKDEEVVINWFLNPWNTRNTQKVLPVGSGYTHHSQTSLCTLLFSRVCTDRGRLQESNPEITANLAKVEDLVIGFSTRGTPAIRKRRFCWQWIHTSFAGQSLSVIL